MKCFVYEQADIEVLAVIIQQRGNRTSIAQQLVSIQQKVICKADIIDNHLSLTEYEE